MIHCIPFEELQRKLHVLVFKNQHELQFDSITYLFLLSYSTTRINIIYSSLEYLSRWNGKTPQLESNHILILLANLFLAKDTTCPSCELALSESSKKPKSYNPLNDEDVPAPFDIRPDEPNKKEEEAFVRGNSDAKKAAPPTESRPKEFVDTSSKSHGPLSAYVWILEYIFILQYVFILQYIFIFFITWFIINNCLDSQANITWEEWNIFRFFSSSSRY